MEEEIMKAVEAGSLRKGGARGFRAAPIAPVTVGMVTVHRVAYRGARLLWADATVQAGIFTIEMWRVEASEDGGIALCFFGQGVRVEDKRALAEDFRGAWRRVLAGEYEVVGRWRGMEGTAVNGRERKERQ